MVSSNTDYFLKKGIFIGRYNKKLFVLFCTEESCNGSTSSCFYVYFWKSKKNIIEEFDKSLSENITTIEKTMIIYSFTEKSTWGS